MRSISLTLALTFAIIAAALSQIPEGIKYQGVARNGIGELISKRDIHVRISILNGSAQGSADYIERHLVKTNDYGLFNIVIGNGTPQNGNFNNISWETGSKWVKIELDPNGGNNFYFAGTSEMLSVPYSKISETSLSDPSSENELITHLSYNHLTQELTLIEAGHERKIAINVKADDLSDNTLNDLADVDASPVIGNFLRWNGLKWIAGMPDPQIQTLSIVDNVLTIAHGNSIDLTPFLDNTDNQQLSYSPATHTLTLENGGSVDLTPIVEMGKNISLDFDSVTNTLTINDGSGSISVSLEGIAGNDADSDPENELQELILVGNTLFISDGNSVDLSHYINTDEQTLSLSGNDLSITGGNTVDLLPFMDNTDSQTLSLTGNDLSISGGNSVDLSPYVNTDAQTLSLSGNDLTIAGGNTVDLSSVNTDQQTLSLSGTDVSISNGNTVDFSLFMDNTDAQTLSISGTDLSIAGGNTVDLSSVNTDQQTLSLSGTDVSISNGNTVDFSVFMDNTDAQTLSISGNNLSIVGGNTVDLSSVNTDQQTLSLSGTDLSIAGGNTVDLSSVNTDQQTLSLSGTDVSISNGNTVDFSVFLDNTDNQNLSLSNDTLYIQNGNSVYLGSSSNQTLNLSGNSLSISDGNSVNLDNLTLTGETKFDGTFSYKIKSVNGIDDPYYVSDESVILADGSFGAMQVRLPAAATAPGKVFIIKKIDSTANAITVKGHSLEVIDGALTPVLSVQYAFIQVISTGTQWFIIGK